MNAENRFHFDQIVIGSGFGGAVAALRFSERGYRVCVLERGKRWEDDDFPTSNWNLLKYLWLPQLGLKGLLECTITPKLVAVHASGVGGGSLVYANVHLIPERRVFEDEAWTQTRSDWHETLLPFYGLAQRMLGVERNPYQNLADHALQHVAEQMGRADTYDVVNAAICFGPDGEEARAIPDPYFAGDGPQRAYCRFCGGCLVGCRYNAKNTLVKNYLHFAERNGVQIFAETTAVRIQPLPGVDGTRDGSAGYEVTVEKGSLLRKRRYRIRARGVTISAGVLSTIPFLLKARDSDRTLPRLSGALGQKVRTNSETLLTASSAQGETWQGIAITSVMKSDDETHVEVTRYPKGSDVAFAGRLPLPVPGSLPYAIRSLLAVFSNPRKAIRLAWPFGRAKNNVFFLVMQSADTFVHLLSQRAPLTPWRRWAVVQRAGDKPLRTSFPSAEQAARLFAEETGGIPGQFVLAVTGRPITAHPLSGVPIGTSAATGVVDEKGEVFGYQNLRVLDASIIPGNLGVNPALTILALGEYAMSQVPVLDADRAQRIKPVLFSNPAPRSVSALSGSGDLLEVVRDMANRQPGSRRP